MAKTPEQIWASMNADQQKAFQANNKDFSVDMIKSPVNQQNASDTFSPIDMNVGVNTGNVQGAYGFNSNNTTRATPTVATPSNPLLIKQPGATNLEYDPTNPQDFIYKLQARKASGGKISEQDMYNYQVATDAQRKSQLESSGGDPYQQWIQQQQDMITAQQKQQADALQTAEAQKKAELDAKYGILRDQTTEAGKRQADAGQKATSFSGFGRSTFNADQQAQIAKQTGQALTQLENAKALELQAWKAEQAGADAEALAPLYASIQKAKDASAQYQIDAIKAANDANAKTGASFTDALSNLMAVASESGLNMDTKGFEQAATAMQGMTEQEKQSYLSNFDQQEQLLLMGLSNQTAPGDFQFVAGTKTQGSGYFNKNTGEFVPLSQASARGIGGGGGGSGGTGQANASQNELINRLKRIKEATSNSILPRSSILNDPEYQADLAYLKANMTFDKIAQMKKEGVKLGVLSDSDMRVLGEAALTLTPGMKKESIAREVDRLIKGLGGDISTQTKTSVPTSNASDEDILAFLNS